MIILGEPCEQPRHLSPSSIGTWQQCPLRYRYSRLDKIPEPSTKEQILGSYTHEVLETLYGLPADQRTLRQAKDLCASLWVEPWGPEIEALGMSQDDQRAFRWQAWWCIEALWKMEDPSTVELAGIEERLEMTVGDATLLGIVDRWQLLPDGTALISDYKTGKKAKPKYEAEKRFQLGVYTLLVEDVLSVGVSSAELLYLKEGVRWAIKPSNDLRAHVTNTVKSVWSEITESCASGQFTARTSILCDWCAYKPTCPAWKGKK